MADENEHLKNLHTMREKAVEARRELARMLAPKPGFVQPDLVEELNRFTAMQDLADAIDRAIDEEEAFDEDQDD